MWKPHEILQLGYVCRRLESAVDYFVERTGAGPFFLFEVPEGSVEYIYRGAPMNPKKNRVAFGYRGLQQIELFETDNPLFDHVRNGSDIAYHHCMQMTDGFEKYRDDYASRGYQTMGTARMPGACIHYIDTVAAIGHYTELFDYNVAMNETDGAMFQLFEIMYRTSLNWDGSDRLRDMPQLP